MKSRLTILMMAALFLGACTSGSYVTGYYSDDIYFNPGDVPPPIAAESSTAKAKGDSKSDNKVIISNIQESEEGSKMMNNYIFGATDKDAKALTYSMDQYDMYSSDTTVYQNEDEVNYVINNYYDGESIDYAYRIRRFHRPHFYDPFYWDAWYYDPYYYDPYFYSSWYSPAWSYGWGWGHGWYSPWSSWGWGYSPWYSSWYSPYYAGYYGGFYGGYYGSPWYGHGNGGYVDSENYRYGQRRSTGSGVVYGDDYVRRSTTTAARSSSTGTKSAGEVSSRRSSSVTEARIADSRTQTTQRAVTNSNVATERRRTDGNNNAVRTGTQRTTSSQSYTRPGNSATRSYTRPSTGVSASPRVVTPESRSGNVRYTNPGSSSSYNRTYRTNSTYNRSSGTRSSTPVYRAPETRSGSTYQRSTPPRSSSPS